MIRKATAGGKRVRRGHTRESLILGALSLLDGKKSFDSLSLRELTRAVGIVPTAFYRHFPTMDALGLALVDESFRALREILRDVRQETRPTDKLIHAVVKSLLKHIRENRAHFRFVAGERFGGQSGVRDAIRREFRLLQSELAMDLSRFPGVTNWSNEDLHMLASLMINAMVAIAEELLDRDDKDRVAQKELMDMAERQLRLIMLAVPHWRSQG